MLTALTVVTRPVSAAARIEDTPTCLISFDENIVQAKINLTKMKTNIGSFIALSDGSPRDGFPPACFGARLNNSNGKLIRVYLL